jgi:hypothetical protein
MKYKLLLGLMIGSQFIFATDDPNFEYYRSICTNFKHGSGGNGCGPKGLAYQAAYNDGNESVARHFLEKYNKHKGGKPVEFGKKLYDEDKIEEYLPKQASFKQKISDWTEIGELIKRGKRDEFVERWETNSHEYIYRRIEEVEEEIRRFVFEEFQVRKRKG